MSTAAKRRYAAAAFVTLLLLSVFWPSPFVSSNRLWFGGTLAVDDLSFLGREAPSWDVAFWCIAGLLLLAMLQSAESLDFASPIRELRTVHLGRAPVIACFSLILGALTTVLVTMYADERVLAWAEGIQSEWTEDAIRILNRFGGGMNPALIVIFFLVAGVAYRERRWVGYAVAMAMAGAGAGLAAQVVKLLVGRARPELWLGSGHYAPGSSTSFPSGHTVGAFALGGVLLFAARSRTLRLVALLLAIAVGLSRILAFRHWASDVTASAALGLIHAGLAAAAVTPLTKEDRPPS